MKELNNLVVLAKEVLSPKDAFAGADAVFEWREQANPTAFLAISEAFLALEQRAEAAEARIAELEEVNKHLDLALRMAEGVGEALRRQAVEANYRIDRLQPLQFCMIALADILSVNAEPKEVIEGVQALVGIRGAAVPVAWTSQRSLETRNKIVAFTDDMSALDYGIANGWTDIVELFTHPAPPMVPPVRAEHAEWSQATFGSVGPVGPLKHLAKEAIEAAEAPDDLSEWADMQFLFWDAQRRAGITDAQIEQAMIEKLAINKARTWPEPKDGEPRLHVKSADGEGLDENS